MIYKTLILSKLLDKAYGPLDANISVWYHEQCLIIAAEHFVCSCACKRN